ncbi:MAG TPA: ribbon-helix-helix protein, CopG family [Thermoanaerobaculia bacterium]|jgi:predicted DNA-binding protein|nr:ribbon-helix-helix protein, CopG family [Thermoanaerobaculia bacterium]
MKVISVHVPEEPYQRLKSLAAREGRPAAELVREAMQDYLARSDAAAHSLLDVSAHDSGRLRKGWTRSGLLDEMLRS